MSCSKRLGVALGLAVLLALAATAHGSWETRSVKSRRYDAATTATEEVTRQAVLTARETVKPARFRLEVSVTATAPTMMASTGTFKAFVAALDRKLELGEGGLRVAGSSFTVNKERAAGAFRVEVTRWFGKSSSALQRLFFVARTVDAIHALARKRGVRVSVSEVSYDVPNLAAIQDRVMGQLIGKSRAHVARVSRAFGCTPVLRQWTPQPIQVSSQGPAELVVEAAAQVRWTCAGAPEEPKPAR